MDAYVEEIRKLENKFSGLEIHHVDRDNNVGADILSKLGYRTTWSLCSSISQDIKPKATDTEAPATVREVLMIK